MAGFSLGGNILANYLGEEGKEAPVVAGFALGQPYDLGACDQYMRYCFGPSLAVLLTTTLFFFFLHGPGLPDQCKQHSHGRPCQAR